MQIDYFSEAGLWYQWLKEKHPEVKTVSAVAFNNDFGKSYVAGFDKAIEGTDLKVIDQQFHEPTEPNLTNQFTTLAASKADVGARRDVGHVLHAGDGRAREAEGLEAGRDHLRRRAVR